MPIKTLLPLTRRSLHHAKGVFQALALCLLTACDSDTLVHRYQHLPDEGWARTDTLLFSLPPAPRTGTYTVHLGLRYDNRFPYQGLFLVAETHLTHPLAHRLDTLRFLVADDEGQPLGRGINLQQLETPLLTLHLHKGQQGTIRLRHIMRREVMPSVSDVGLLVTLDQ